MNFVAIKNRFRGGPNNIKEELKLKKLTRKKINKIERLETEIEEEIEELKTKVNEHKSSKLLDDLNMEKGIQIQRIKEIEIKLEKLKMPKKKQ